MAQPVFHPSAISAADRRQGEDRRKGGDRRKIDKGPPGRRDRRVNPEPRKPEVDELEVSVSDWARLQGEEPNKR